MTRHTSKGLVVVATFAAMLLGTSSAQANVSHVFKTTFGSSTSGVTNPYPISEPIDVAVDQETEDVYVTDPGHHRVEKFTSQGAFILMFGLEVNKTAVEASRPASEQNVCPAPGHPGDVCQSGTSAESPGAYSEPAWLAVDNYPFGGGAVYVGDLGDNVVTKVTSSGQVVNSWGVHGQKNGSDDPNLPLFGPLFGLAVGAGCATPSEPLTGRCNPNGTLYVAGHRYGENVREYTQGGEWIVDGFTEGSVLKVNAKGELFYIVSPFGSFGNSPEVWKTLQKPGTPGEGTPMQVTTDFPAAGFGLDPSTEELYEAVETRNDELEPHGVRIDHYSADCEPQKGACEPEDAFGEGQLNGGRTVCAGEGYGSFFSCEFPYKGVAVDGSTHSVYVVDKNELALFTDARPIVTTKPASAVTTSSATLNGHIDPAGRGNIVSCRFEYGYDKTYGHSVPCTPDPAASPPGSNFTAPEDVSADITGLSPGTAQHFRVVASNTAGATTTGADEIFTTTAPPAIDGLLAEKVTAESAELQAKVNPNGLPTIYHFQYGTSVLYGQEVSGTIPAANSDQEITAQLSGLTPHQTYHYRLVVENKVEGKEEGGTTTSEDHSFNFFPPSCPNQNVRQQVKANYVPECRAYELVSPGDAKGTQLYPGGPNTGYATSPSRLSFTGLWSILPESGGSPLDSVGDLYVSTRTSSGWVTRYVGPPASEVSTAGGPPQGLFNQGGPPFLGYNTASASAAFRADIIQNNDLTDPQMDTFLDWSDGSNELGFRNKTPIASNAPYVWKADGSFVDRWPTNLAAVRPGLNPYLEGGVSPGGMEALNCPEINQAASYCPGEIAASAELNHFAFSTEWNIFATGGQLSPPGSVYDNDTAAGTVTVASRLPSGGPIPSEPTDHAGDPLEIPGLSANGSHVLIDSPGTGPCGLVNCPVPPCGASVGVIHCPTYPGHFYMRVNDTVTFDVSQGHEVTYVGTTADYTKVYFTSEEQLTNEDHDSSVDLYMWSQKGAEEGHPLVLVSKGDNPGNAGEPGQSDSCIGGFSIPGEGKSKNCDVITYSEQAYCQLTGGQGGNCRSDNSIAADNGDIYFFSPEQLDGSRGIPNRLNLYDYRNGKAQYVATFSGGQHCIESPVPGFTDNACSATPIARIQVSPDDSHAAFLTDSPVTQYNSAGFLEMYIYDPAARRLVCASCIPNGEPPQSDVEGSQDGLFMTNDGRVFFSTEDPLTHSDTNNAQDIYEYIEGRPQLITTGTGETRVAAGFTSSLLNPPGLVGVSADGTDVYFSTYDTLTPADRNGLFLKFYDARAGGGFSSNAEQPPCEAADECHGAGSLPPPPIEDESGAVLTGGNAGSAKQQKKHKKHKKHHARHHRHQGGSR